MSERGAARGRARGRAMTNPWNVPEGGGPQSEAGDDELSASVSTFGDAGGPELNARESASSAGSTTSTTLGKTSVSSSVAGVGSSVGSLLTVVGEGKEATSEPTPSKGIRQTIKTGFNKVGTTGEKMSVITNYLHVNKTPNFQLHQYRVDFKPEEDDTYKKKRLMRSQEEAIGAYVFDGHMLYTTRPIPMEKRELIVPSTTGEVAFTIYIKNIGYVLPDSPMYLQFYNMVMRKCMQLLKFEELGRHFYNPAAAIKLPEDKLELWPGIVTAIRNHQVGTLLCVEITHKVLRMSPVIEKIFELRDRFRNNMEGWMKAVKEEFVGTIVMTHYNRKTYKVDDIDFDTTPNSTFMKKDGSEMRYADYYLERYKQKIQNLMQPMLVSYPKKKDVNKGETGNIFLVPALCNPTGLTDDMRKNFTLMKKLSEHLHMGPRQRKAKLDEFVRTLKENTDVKKEFQDWDIDFDPRYLMANARQFPKEKIYMGPEGSEPTEGDETADWTRKLRGRGMWSSKEFNDWIIFVPQRDNTFLEQFLETLKLEGRKLGVNVGKPVATVNYQDRPLNLIQTMKEEFRKRGTQVKFAFIILPNNNLKAYTDAKRLCILDYSIGCQCFLAKNMNKSDPKSRQKLGSICVKVMIQITAKLGGVPWCVKIPVKRLMVLGFDVYHCSDRKGQSVGALVSTTDQSLTRYHSMVGFHKDKSELAHNLTASMLKSLQAYLIDNEGALPDRVVLFRDGVGEGQINYVLDYEIPRLRKAIEDMYDEKHQERAKLSVVIVTKKINSRAMLEKSEGRITYSNVGPGTVIDNTITLPERYDYFLVSQSVNQGTVSPTNYNVVVDDSGFTPDHMQKLSFKLCHLYYNWCGTVAVPAPCQYAHKLAYLTGVSLNNEAPSQLANCLWFL